MKNFKALNQIIPTIQLTDDMNRRAKLDTGKECNYKCSFCYYRNQLDEVDSFEVIKERIDYLAECGFNEIDLSGGESSIHENFLEIIRYAKSKNLSISMLSNGSKFDNINFLKESQEAGLEEILFSLHGYKHEHDKIVHVSGAYDKLIKSIQNCKVLGINVRINTTITQLFKSTDEMIQVYKEIDPFELNILTLNEFADAKTYFPYSKSIPIVKNLLNGLTDHIQLINVRYTPFCMLKGYEKHVCNTLQHIYDIYDWNVVSYGMNVEPSKVLTDPLEYKNVSIQRRTKYYHKDTECMSCSHFKICDGVENNAKNYLLEPYKGDKIDNINHYREGFYNE